MITSITQQYTLRDGTNVLGDLVAETVLARPTVMGRLPPIDMSPRLIMLAGELVIDDRSCDSIRCVLLEGFAYLS